MIKRVAALGAVALTAAGLALLGTGSSQAAPAVATGTLPAGPSLSPTADTSWWGTNGRVDDIVSDGQSAWIAGAFDYVGPTTGRAVVTDPATGDRVSTGRIRVDGTVEAVAADGQGGYYLAGSFTRIGDLRRVGIAHVLSTGQVDRTFNPGVTGAVHVMAVTPTRIVVGGDLTSVAGVPVSRVGVMTRAGAPVPGWSVSVNGSVRALKQVGSSVYVGGGFSVVNGSVRNNIARVSLDTGALDSWAPRTDASVWAIDVAAGGTRALDMVGIGGDFTSVSGTGGTVVRQHLAAVDGNGAVLAWAPATSARVYSIALNLALQRVLVGGTFTTVAGLSRTGVALVGLDGSVQPFDAQLAGCQLPHTVKNTNQFVPCSTEVNTVSWVADGSGFFVGGLFTTTQGAVRHDAASYTLASGSVTPWTPLPSARVRTIVDTPQGVVLGGEFTSTGGIYRRGVAKIDLSTGQADPAFSADTNQIVLDLELDAAKTSLFLGGTFRTVGGVARNKVAKVSAATGKVDREFRVGANKDVQALAVRGGGLYLAGLFTKIGQVGRAHAAKVSTTTGDADPAWVSNTAGPGGVWKGGAVRGMAVAPDGSRVFLAGGFTSVNGLSVAGGIVAVDGRTGAVNPSRLGGLISLPTVHCNNSFMVQLQLSDDGRRLYGGDLCPDGIYQWDAINLAGSRSSGVQWINWCNGGMQGRLEVNGRFYLGSHGGDRGKGGSCWASPTDRTIVTASRAMAFTAGTGQLQAWAPLFDTPMGVWAYAAVPQGLLVGGDFTVAGDRTTQQQGLALFRGTP